MAAASPILRWYAFPVVALSAVSKGFTGHGLPVRCHFGSAILLHSHVSARGHSLFLG